MRELKQKKEEKRLKNQYLFDQAIKEREAFLEKMRKEKEKGELKRVIAIFDVNLTLTPPRQRVRENMLEALSKLKAKGIDCAIVSSNHIKKIRE